MARKVLNIDDVGIHLYCIKDDSAKANPYRLYTKWYDNGWHRKQIAKYEDLTSVMWHIHQIAMGK